MDKEKAASDGLTRNYSLSFTRYLECRPHPNFLGMSYTQRVCHLISDGDFIAPVALYYTGTGMWSGEYALSEYAARELTEHQIDFDLVTLDLLSEADDLARGLTLNGQTYRALVAPYSEFVTADFERFARRAAESGFPVLFLDRSPRRIADADRAFDAPAEIIPFDALVPTLKDRGICEVEVSPACDALRCIHYRHDHDIYLFSNESLGETFKGSVTVPASGPAYIYDPMENQCRPVEAMPCGQSTWLDLTVKPYELYAVVFDEPPAELHSPVEAAEEGRTLPHWRVSLCRAKEYPAFGPTEPVESFEQVSDSHPDFSGFIRYETAFESDGAPCALALEDAYESVEVWCNGVWCGQKLTPEFLFDLNTAVVPGENHLRVEVATTLERKTNAMPEAASPFQLVNGFTVTPPIGLMGTARLVPVKR